jgi:hypothetical protein
MCDNKVFNINGRTVEQLKLAVDLLLLTEYGDKQKVRGWYFAPDKGLVLTWKADAENQHPKATPFTNRMGLPTEIETDELVETLWNWLFSEQAKTVTYNDEDNWDRKIHDSDVSTEIGWRLYTDVWGHVGYPGLGKDGPIDHYSIAAFKPVYLWYGK